MVEMSRSFALPPVIHRFRRCGSNNDVVSVTGERTHNPQPEREFIEMGTIVILRRHPHRLFTAEVQQQQRGRNESNRS